MSWSAITLLVLSIFLISTSMISSEAIQAELYREGHRVVSGIFKAKLVASRMQCLHLCKSADGCQGMNMERGKKNDALKCELTSQIVHNVVGNDGSLKEDDNWEFYKVTQMVQPMRPKYHIKVASYAQQETHQPKDPRDLSYLIINGKYFELDKGYNVLTFDFDEGFESTPVEIFRGQDQELLSFLNGLKTGDIFIFLVVDTGPDVQGGVMEGSLKYAMISLGTSLGDRPIGYRQPYCFISMVRSNASWQTESLGKDATLPSHCEAMIF